VNHVVGEVELHFVKRKVREGDFLRVDWGPIAVIAEHSRGTVGVNFQVPDLELFAGNASIMLLGDCDDVEQPVSAALVGKELCAVREEYGAIDAVAIPVLGAGELAELNFGECCCVRHVVPLFLEVTPTAGAREAQNAAEHSAAVIAFWGDRDRRACGSQNSVIDGKRRQLKCHPPAVHWVTEKRPF